MNRDKDKRKNRQLYVVNTYYQLITALHMKIHIFPDSEADVIITDRSSDAEHVTERLKKTGIFGHVYYARITSMSIFTKIDHVTKILCDDHKFPLKCSNFELRPYDELLYYNYNYFFGCLFCLLQAQNPNMLCHRFEEGFGSTFSYYAGTRWSTFFQEKVARFYGHPSFFSSEDMYFYEPEFVQFAAEHKIVPLKKIGQNDRELQRVLRLLFGESNKGEYDRKYIFFEGPYAQDGVEVNDFELVLQIAKVVGPENVMVKLHPRTRVDRFSPHGIKTNKAVGVPWEAIIMDSDFSEHVFLTIASGSVLSPRILFGQQVPTYMLFNCTTTKAQIVNESFHAYLEQFEKKYGEEGFYIPSDNEEFIRCLEVR